MVPKPDKTIAEQAQILAMQQISDTLRRLSNTIESQGARIQEMRDEITWFKAREEQMADLRETVAGIEQRITSVEIRAAQQDGAFKLANFLKEYMPWIVALAAFVYSMFGPYK
jgi:predicted  nucleic acid-binding Zn-ribbon protein